MKNVTPCIEWEKMLSHTHPADLSPSERFELAAHLASCPACAQTRAYYYRMDALLQNLPTTNPLPSLPPKLLHLWEEENRQRLSSRNQPHARRQKFRKRTRFFRLPTVAQRGTLSYIVQRGTAAFTLKGGIATAMATGIIVALLLLTYPFVFVHPNAAVIPQAKATAPARTNTSPSSTKEATSTARATATAEISLNYDTLVTSGQLTLNDPLQDNAHGNSWNTINGLAGGCFFSKGAYHTLSLPQSPLVPCLAASTHFDNFLFQVQLTIVQGDQAGIIFRADAVTESFYAFEIDRAGSYALERYDHFNLTRVIQKGSSSAIHTGHNQPNQIAVAAQGDHLSLFINKQHVASASDGSYSSGQIGVFARSINNLTNVVFSDVMVWLLR